MFFCILLVIIIWLWIILDFTKLKKKIIFKHSNLFERILLISIIALFAYAFFIADQSEILFWMDKNRIYYLIYLLSALIWITLEIICCHKKYK